MKKIILTTLTALLIGSVIFISCKSKNDGNALTPKYKQEAGTGGNPNITNVTTTGTISTTSSPYQNSTMPTIGTGGTWSSTGCTGASCLNITNSSLGTTATVCFSSPPVAGTYVLVSSAGALSGTTGKASITVTNPTGQPTGTTWYSSGGSVSVTVSGSGAVTATFNNIACLQAGSAFPTVTISGQAGCL